MTQGARASAPAPGRADVGLIGLGVMGQNLALNLSDHGYGVIVHDREGAVLEQYLSTLPAQSRIRAAATLGDLLDGLTRPRRIIVLIKAGAHVDTLLDDLARVLDDGDIVVDLGNSHYLDSERRCARLKECGLRFVGSGISGGEQGARSGASLMPGGDERAWPELRPVFEAVAAVAEGRPCVSWMGSGGAGHYVKMVHNGIEYGDMQLIAESYQLLRVGLGLDCDALADVFGEWNATELESYLIEITGRILAVRDEDGAPLVDRILDVAAQKGTGRWAASAALEQDVPVTLITEAVFARFVSALKAERVAAASVLAGPDPGIAVAADRFVEQVRLALLAAKIVSYAQGFMLLRAGASRHGWSLDYGEIALIWRAGCVIRSGLLNHVHAAFRRRADLPNLLLDHHFRRRIDAAQSAWRSVVAEAVRAGIPVPAFASALAFYDGYRARRLPADLIQAQRDYFGAHGYQRTDGAPGETLHTAWSRDPSDERDGNG